MLIGEVETVFIDVAPDLARLLQTHTSTPEGKLTDLLRRFFRELFARQVAALFSESCEGHGDDDGSSGRIRDEETR